MRVLKIFFSFVFALLILGSLSWLSWREIQLYRAISQVRSSARKMRELQPSGQFSQNCLIYGGSPVDSQTLTRTQLRFISNKDYVLEIVCQTNESLRQLVEEATLPMLVNKDSNQSGLIFGQKQHGVTLSILGRTGVVYEGESFIQSATRYRVDDGLILDQGPVTACTGYGFTCCDETYQLGQNEQNTQALDCPKSCYESCIEKPVILSFHSLPSYSSAEKIIQIQSGEQVEFFYTVNDIQGDLLTRRFASQEEWSDTSWSEKLIRVIESFFNQQPVTDSLEKIIVSFGDKETAELSDLQGSVVHTYTCNQRLCVYNATIQAMTKNKITSSLDQDSSIQIQVQGQ